MTNQNVNCGCSKPKRPVKIVSSAGCSADYAAVVTLPDIVKTKHSGPILAKYLEERKNKHETAIQSLHNASKEINIKIDTKIRQAAETLLNYIEGYQQEIECTIKNYSNKQPLSREIKMEALEKIKNIISEQVEFVNEFKQKALALDRQRGDDHKVLLRNKLQHFISIGHETPKDLMFFFEQLGYEMNQQLLSNARAYVDLEAQLNIQADNSFTQAKAKLFPLCLDIPLPASANSLKKTSSTERRISSASKISSAPDKVLSFILNDAVEFEEYARKLVIAYKSAVLKVFTGILRKLKNLHKDIDEQSFIDKYCIVNCPDLQEEKEQNNLCSLSEMQMYQGDTLNCGFMIKTLKSLADRLKGTYKILHDAGHIWDQHMLRLAVAQKLTMVAVEDLLTAHDALEQANEIPFNIALEQLRSCPDLDKVNTQYDFIVGILNGTSNTYDQNHAIESNRLKEFSNLIPLLTNTLLSEIDCFLTEHTRLPSIYEKSLAESDIYKRPSALSDKLNSKTQLAIFLTKLQVQSVLNWSNGFLELFEKNLPSVAEDLKCQADRWIEERLIALKRRYMLKKNSHSVRLERVAAIRDARIAELTYHERRLNSHLQAIQKVADSLMEDASTFLSLDSPDLYPLSFWIDRIQIKINDILSSTPRNQETLTLKLSSYASRIIIYRRNFEESLDNALKNYRNSLEQMQYEALFSNLRFMTHIKSLSERKFSAVEATKACLALTRAGDGLVISWNKTLEILSQRRNFLLQLAENKIEPVQRVIDENLKTGKSVAKKPAGVKKK